MFCSVSFLYLLTFCIVFLSHSIVSKSNMSKFQMSFTSQLYHVVGNFLDYCICMERFSKFKRVQYVCMLLKLHMYSTEEYSDLPVYPPKKTDALQR